jgi:hypothetical protein
LVAVYKFSSDSEEGRWGQFRIDKSNGDIREVQTHPEDSDKKLYMRAARKVFLNYKKGEYPEITCWAS